MNYRTVYADPPWNEQGGGRVKRGADRHYSLLKTREMPQVIRGCNQWQFLAESVHMYMWVTNNYLLDGLWLISELGFKYKTMQTWAKPSFGLGYYFRGQTEHLLFATRGATMQTRKTDGHYSTLLGKGIVERERDSSTGKILHSRKPECTYEMIEASSPPGYLELFARTQRENWTSWGNEIEGSEQARQLRRTTISTLQASVKPLAEQL